MPPNNDPRTKLGYDTHQEHKVEVHSALENITCRLENIETRLSLSDFVNPDQDES